MEDHNIVLPKEMQLLFDSAEHAWALKNIQGCFVYVNSVFSRLLKLPNIIGSYEADLTASNIDYAQQLQDQGYEVIEYPYFEQEKVKVGTLIQGRKIKLLPMRFFMQQEFHKLASFNLPSTHFTEKEWEVGYLLVCRATENEMAEQLDIDIDEVKSLVKKCLQKEKHQDVESFIKDAVEKDWDRHIPPRFAGYQNFITL